jgi:hypothetical protein
VSDQHSTPLNSDKPEKEPEPTTDELSEKDLDKVAAGLTYNLTQIQIKSSQQSGGGSSVPPSG